MDDDLRDRLALRALVEAYAFAVDRRDEAAFRALWTDDAVLTTHVADGPAVTEKRGVDAIAAVTTLIARHEATLHVVANHEVVLDGDDATGEADALAHHLSPGGDGTHVDLEMGIRYRDAYRRGADGTWRFARRRVHKQWTRRVTVQRDPAEASPGPNEAPR